MITKETKIAAVNPIHTQIIIHMGQICTLFKQTSHAHAVEEQVVPIQLVLGKERRE